MASSKQQSAEPLVLGQMPLSEFLRDYWQKKPCLFRQAMPDFESPIDANELAGLAMEESIESRLVVEQRGSTTPWALHNGPFDEDTLTGLPDSHWTLLVQAVDQFVPEVSELLKQFDFLPRWRLDDIMISFAPEGGSVGPHFDQYDVFLVQAAGHRRWQVGQVCDQSTALLEGTPLKILAQFADRSDMDWVLAPGDVLYLPPALAHHGVAEDACMTWSVGFRAPDAVEALHGLALRGDLEPDADFLRYHDGNLTAEESQRQDITPEAVERVKTLLHSLSGREDVLADWLGAFMTQNKYDAFDWDSAEETPVDLPADTLLSRALPTRMTTYGARFYCNGRAFPLDVQDKPLINLLLNQDQWTWGELNKLAKNDTSKRLLALLVNSDSIEIDWGEGQVNGEAGLQ